jgi:hypothetical protein
MDGTIPAIQTGEYLGIKSSFEIEQYEEAHYNFTYVPLGLFLDPDISKCGTLRNSGTYTLTKDLTTTRDCLKISGDDITVNLNGYSITGDKGTGDNGIEKDGYINLTVMNGHINSFGRAIYSVDSEKDSYYNLILNNNYYGISFLRVGNTTVFNNTLNTLDRSGLHLYRTTLSNFDNNQFYNCSNDLIGDSSCIELYNSMHNNFTNSKANISAKKGIMLKSDSIDNNASNNYFKDIELYNINEQDVYLQGFFSGSALNNTLLNVTYDDEFVDYNTSLIRKWYYRAYVGNVTPIYNANLTGYNVTGDYNFNLTTNISGYTEIHNIIDYYNEFGTKHIYSNYSFNVTHPNCTDHHSYNVSYELNNLNDTFNCGVAPPPPPAVPSDVLTVIYEDLNSPFTQLGKAIKKSTVPFIKFAEFNDFIPNLVSIVKLDTISTGSNLVSLNSSNITLNVPYAHLGKSLEFSKIPYVQLNASTKFIE